MNRKEFMQKSLQSGFGCCALLAVNCTASADDPPKPPEDNTKLKFEKEFVQNWLTDLLETTDAVLDQPTKVKLMEGCGRGCFRRFQFKQDIANQGKGDLQKLLAAYKKNFEVWQEGDLVHIRYGEVSSHCYCPAAYYRPAKPHDLHCECTRTTHQTIFETALGRPFKVDIVESLRRGGKTCHFVVHLT
jgi:hypothetical protein